MSRSWASAVAQDPAELRCLVVGVEQRHHRADAGDGEPADDPLRAVRREQADPGALADARREQALGQLGRPPPRPRRSVSRSSPRTANVCRRTRSAHGADELTRCGREGGKAGTRTGWSRHRRPRDGSDVELRRRSSGGTGCRPSPWPCRRRRRPSRSSTKRDRVGHALGVGVVGAEQHVVGADDLARGRPGPPRGTGARRRSA